MSNQLLEKLEQKIENAIQLIELLRLQIEDLEEKNHQLQAENGNMKQHQIQWEQSLNALLRKLDNAHVNTDKVEKKNNSKKQQNHSAENDFIESEMLEDVIA